MSAQGQNRYKGNVRVTKRPKSCLPIARLPLPCLPSCAPPSRTGRAISCCRSTGETPSARRYRDLVTEFAGEAGGMAALPASAQQLVRRLAQVSVELELLKSQRATGEAIDPVAFVTLVNSQRRLLRDRSALRPKPKALSLAEHVARTYGPRSDGAHDPARPHGGLPCPAWETSGPRCRATIWEQGLRDRTPPRVLLRARMSGRRLERCRPAFSGDPVI